MKKSDKPENMFPTAKEDVSASKLMPDTPQTRSESYRLAYSDEDFMLREELRPVRLQLELLKPELLQKENNILSTIVIFGSARIPDYETAVQRLKKAEALAESDITNETLARKVKIAKSILEKSRYYDEARELARLITLNSQQDEKCDHVVITGGGPGIMEAANRGANDVGGKSIGLNIVLPFEQEPNPYITPELCFQFHYFAIRKMHFLKRARALIVCPGGFGTLDELFETLTLIQTKKIKPFPILLLGSKYWHRVINFDVLVEEGTVDESDLDIFEYVDSAEQAMTAIREFYDL
ncbi:MAG: TIGR00730 family Rossman fold protein [Gammaproteobacteria bacterium]|nr:TIGR00730 family Rossman fold protein [Gammaproteobacteria bacterium]